MSAEEVQSLLESAGVADDDAADLVAWASERAAALIMGLDEDPELGGLLRGDPTAASNEPVPALAAAAAGLAPAEEFDREVTQPHARVPLDAADLPPIPSGAGGAAESLEDIEELDVEELELLDDEDLEDDDEGDDDEGATSTMPALSDGPVGPDGRRIDAAAAPCDDDVEDESAQHQPDEATVEGDAPEGEESAAAERDEPEAGAEPAEANEAGEGPTFGPPDGTDEVPAWKAALFSAQSGDDALAAQRVKEESSAGYLPDGPAEANYQEIGRLESEEDEISQHSVDLSDLDGDPAKAESEPPSDAADDDD